VSRSNYSDDLEPWELIRYRGQVASAVRGRRGQRMLRDLRDALEAMPNRRLTTNHLEDGDGEVCAFGALGKSRGIDLSELDPGDPHELGAAFNVADQLAGEVVFMNDEATYGTPEDRWAFMHSWTLRNIRAEAS